MSHDILADLEHAMSAHAAEYIRNRYSVPAQIGGRIRFHHAGRDGTIVDFDGLGAYLWVLLDGDSEPVKLHPTWMVEYLTDSAAAS